MPFRLLASVLVLIFAVTPSVGVGSPPNLSELRLPAGYAIEVWADEVANARSMTRSPRGTVFVGTRTGGGRVYAIREGQNGKRDVKVIASGLNSPNGVAFRQGALYVAEIDRITRYDDIDTQLDQGVTTLRTAVTVATLPADRHHGWRYIAFGPDDKLYVPIGAPCNVCDRDSDGYSMITRINPDGTGREIVARGVRNTVGFRWHPKTGDLWFTDNGRDMLGDDTPPCELNRVSRVDEHFGFPFCHGKDVVDPQFGKLGRCSDATPPVQELGPHVAPLGVMFDAEGNAIIAEHGSWNRKEKIGYRLTRVRLQGNRAVAYEEFVGGWLRPDGKVTGRPVDLVALPDGSMLVSDDLAGVIYRVFKSG
jgi:glucose/arabinose dehydrogenase